MLTITADKRNKKDDLDTLRKAGKIPAVFYGKKEASTSISLELKDFIKVWEDAGESTVISIKTPDGEKESLIHDVDVDPVTGVPRHADFYVFEKGHKLEIEVPLEFIGTSPAVKEKGGSLVKVLHEIKIEAMPRDLPKEIEVDISTLKEFDDQITAGEIKLPEGVTLLENPEEAVVLVTAPREEIEEEETPAPDLSEIEISEERGKKEEGENNQPKEAEEEPGN